MKTELKTPAQEYCKNYTIKVKENNDGKQI